MEEKKKRKSYRVSRTANRNNKRPCDFRRREDKRHNK